MSLTGIGNRLTPSIPIEITYGAQPLGQGTKIATLFAHKATSGATAADYSVYTVINIGDAETAQTEVDAIAGTGSEAGVMAAAFVNANQLAGRTNFPNFRFILLPHGETGFGSASEAFTQAKFLRSDWLVSPYPASDAVNRTALVNFATTISGPDRDLMGQYGSNVSLGSFDVIGTAALYAINNSAVNVAYLPDTSSTKAQTEAEVASAYAATLLSLAFPYPTAQGLTIGGLKVPSKVGDWVDYNPQGLSEAALAAGLSPLYIQPGGTVGIIRSITTWNLKPDGVTRITAYQDWQDQQILIDFREQIYQAFQNPPFNNNPGGAKASANIAAFAKDEMIRIAQSFEDQGAFQNVATLSKQFIVQVSTGRFDMRIPIDVISGLFVNAIDIVAMHVQV